MKRRWFIRIFFMLPILLCVNGWAWSYFYHLAIYYAGPSMGGWCGWIETHMGGMDFGSTYASWSPKGWRLAFGAEFPGPGTQIGVLPPTHFLGFYWYRGRSGFPGIDQFVGIPFWFPTLFAALISLFVWRKTRPTKSGGAFPVEVRKQHG